MPKLTRNAIRCNHCNTVIESKHRHDFVWCNCPPDSTTRVFIDGGLDYCRVGFGTDADFTSLAEYEPEEVA